MTALRLVLAPRALASLLALGLVACGPASSPDAGHDDAHAHSDASGPTPTVVATSPADGAHAVAPDATIRALFSLPMRADVGNVTVSDASGPIAHAPPTLDADATTLTVVPSAPLPAGAAITVALDGFESASGAPLARAFTFTFTVADTDPPRVLSSTPAEGEALDAVLSEIVVTLSEPLDAGSGTVAIEGPGAELGAVTVVEDQLRVAVSGLAHDAAYRVRFDGFTDSAGNALDASALGADGALDFTIGPDATAPVVVDASPAEGQLDVSTLVTTRVAIQFSEPMNTAAGAAELVVDAAREVLAQRWELSGTRLVLTVSGLLALDAPHRVELSGYRDLAENALDDTVYLGDGALDFTTGEGSPPYVSFTSPGEGQTDVLPDTTEIVVVFSEAMDTSRTRAMLVGDGRTVEVEGTWSLSGSTLRLDVSRAINAGKSYTVDLSAFTDATGVALDTSHAYLGDGVLSFELVAPRGERCRDALTQTEGEPLPNGHRWTLPATAVVEYNGSASCDADGHGSDMVVRYRKTTPAPGMPGGTALHVHATIGSGDFDVEVRRDVCDPLAPATSDLTLACLHRGIFSGSSRASDLYFDVGPGDYYIWVAQEARSDGFRGAAITVEEIPRAPEGERCENPLTTASASHTLLPGGVHQWSIGEDDFRGLDRAVSHIGVGAEAIACEATDRMSIDAVLEISKTSSTSLVTVDVDASIHSATAPHIHVEVADSCSPTAAGRSVVGCQANVDQRRERTLTIGGPAGTLYAWLVAPTDGSGIREPFPSVGVRVEELEPTAGDTCALAISLSPGASHAIDPNRSHRAYAPSCMPGVGGVTWYRYTATQRLGIVRVAGTSRTAAVIDAASGDELRCGDDAASGAAVIVAPGTEVCIAVASGGGPTTMTIDEHAFEGVLGAPADLAITAGTSTSPTSRWLAATPSALVAMRSTLANQLYSTPIVGGADFAIGTVPTSWNVGNDGRAAPDGSVVALNTSTGASASRLIRIAGADGVPLAAPMPVDTAPIGGYVTRRLDALTFDGASFIAASAGSTGTDPTYFYSIPTAGGQAELLGINDTLNDASGIAADARHVYVVGRVGSTEGVYRLPRDELMTRSATPVLLAGSVPLSADRAAIAVDSTADASAVYFRSSSPADVWMILDPDAAAPRWVGRIWTASASRADGGLAYDPTIPALYLLDTSVSSGTWLELR